MNQMNFKNELEHRVEYINTIIENTLPREDKFQKEIFEAMKYSVIAPGKKIRPILMLETYRLFAGKDESVVEPFMAAIEMIHTYSLVHDDLPAMDNDDYRRGRLTTHVKYGEAMGILTGDSLLNYSMEIVCGLFTKVGEDMMPYIGKALSTLTNKSGVHGMIGGQVIDIFDSGNQNTKTMDRETRIKRLLSMYELKTSALIEASMMIGAILAKATEEEVKIVEIIAKNIGLAFQIQDDILDVTSSEDVLGKPILSDEKNEKETYVTLMGLEKSKEKVKEYSNISLNQLESLNRNNLFLEELIDMLITRKK